MEATSQAEAVALASAVEQAGEQAEAVPLAAIESAVFPGEPVHLGSAAIESAVLPGKPAYSRSAGPGALAIIPVAVAVAAFSLFSSWLRAHKRRGSLDTAAVPEAAAEELPAAEELTAVEDATAATTAPAASDGLAASETTHSISPEASVREAAETPAAVAAAPAPAAAEAAASDGGAMRAHMAQLSSLQEANKRLKEMEEENKRLHDFVSTHMATSNKMKTLEAENQALKEAQARLEADLQEVRTRSIVTDGNDLERFKQGLRLPTGARSVCSVGDSDMAVGDTSASMDGGQVRSIGSKSRSVTQLFNWLNGVKQQQQQPSGPLDAAVAPTTPGGSRRTSRSQLVPGGAAQQPDVAKALNSVAELLERHWQM